MSVSFFGDVELHKDEPPIWAMSLDIYNINWNYGLLPQTWEDPSLANSEVEGAFGDNDPVDVVEIGESRAKIGQILRVKPLGALAMIDEGELDWKIVAISLDDPRASLVNDVDDVEKHFPFGV
ncbi:Soluble inorganic pyrophosphatase 6, chloroplastic [Vitis vinifera]|uniref:inorganic diphosphatase n=1 Tax=Vitis vinifera TaxID=29760 RepID=A0A438EH83_VITVI|nr:Soluble inorganic pyrophosphatase 6, chloroplastic [Vitis vinifera]RVX10378.1 Soluble inorganic pyrophosphatase 6, chloroplastic [Vitis vinifera]